MDSMPGIVLPLCNLDAIATLSSNIAVVTDPIATDKLALVDITTSHYVWRYAMSFGPENLLATQA